MEDDFLLIYLYNFGENKSKAQIAKEFAAIDKEPLGKKLSKIKGVNAFESKNDIAVLQYLTKKRNYIAHCFFIDNKFDTELEIAERKNELLQIKKDAEFIETALNKMLLKYARCKNLI